MNIFNSVAKNCLPISLKATAESFKIFLKHGSVCDVFQKCLALPFCEIDKILWIADTKLILFITDIKIKT